MYIHISQFITYFVTSIYIEQGIQRHHDIFRCFYMAVLLIYSSDINIIAIKLWQYWAYKKYMVTYILCGRLMHVAGICYLIFLRCNYIFCSDIAHNNDNSTFENKLQPSPTFREGCNEILKVLVCNYFQTEFICTFWMMNAIHNVLPLARKDTIDIHLYTHFVYSFCHLTLHSLIYEKCKEKHYKHNF